MQHRDDDDDDRDREDDEQPRLVAQVYIVKPPIMMSSPKAKFMRPMTPNSSASESAISAYRLP